LTAEPHIWSTFINVMQSIWLIPAIRISDPNSGLGALAGCDA